MQFEDAKEEPDDVDGDSGGDGVRGDHEQDAAAAGPAAPGVRDEEGADAAESQGKGESGLHKNQSLHEFWDESALGCSIPSPDRLSQFSSVLASSFIREL